MQYGRTKRLTALLLLTALAACGGAGSGANGALTPAVTAAGHRARPSTSAGLLTRIVGVGDSLTAGYQAGGFLGETGVKNPQDPGHTIPPNQVTGWWADLDEQASSLPLQTAIAQMYDPKVSPLPLIAGPGLNNQVVPAPIPPFFAELKGGSVCADNGGFNAAGYLLSDLSRVRLNPKSTTLRDLGVPGITLHEAITLAQPQTSTCEPLPGVPGLLSDVVADESSTFWPVLGNFARLGSKLSMVAAAASLHPTLATLWLGANDVLKYMGSGGIFVGGDNSAGQTASDVRAAILTLQGSGARVVVANLPNILETPYFQRIGNPSSASLCKVRTYVYCLLTSLGFSPSAARQTSVQIAKTYHLATPNGCAPPSATSPCGYLTLAGTVDVIYYYLKVPGNFTLPDLDCTGTNFTKPCTPGSGLGGYYITPAFAAKIQTLNDSINTGIAEAAQSTSSPLVDVEAFFDGVASGDQSNSYFRQATSINPGVCCTLAFLGGLVSFDGLHPSNTGYALLAYYFIKTINARYGTHIPEIDVRAAYNGTRCTNKTYCFPDRYAPPYNDAAALRSAYRTRTFGYER